MSHRRYAQSMAFHPTFIEAGNAAIGLGTQPSTCATNTRRPAGSYRAISPTNSVPKPSATAS